MEFRVLEKQGFSGHNENEVFQCAKNTGYF